MIFRTTWVQKMYYEDLTIMPQIQILQCGSKECKKFSTSRES